MRKKVLVKGPALSMSGYGEQTRFALRSLRSREDLFDIFLINIPWGKTGWTIEESEETQWITGLMAKTHGYIQQKGSFDISIQVTIPNEFEKIAPVNIGYTAGIETTKIAPQWIEKAKLMDKIIVVSNHSKDVFNNTEYKAKNEQTGQVFDFKNTTPVEVVHFPVKKVQSKELELDLKTDFNFLSVAQWGPRKNVESTIVGFLKEFKNDADVGLVLKLNVAKNCVMDKVACEKRLEMAKKKVSDAKCKVYLLHGNMSDEEMQGLYNHPKIKALVSTTHGEGFGLPLFEAVCNGLPVIAPKWSGHVDFLMAPVKEEGKIKIKNHFTSINFDLNQVNKEAVWDGVIQADSQWCFVKEHSLMDCMRKVQKNHGSALAPARKLKEYVLEEFKEEKQIKNFLNSLGIFTEILFLEPQQINGLSFCIPTHGKRKEKTLKTIKSIQKQNWNGLPYEIIIAGDIDNFKGLDDNIKLIDLKNDAHNRKVAKLRNFAADRSIYDNIVFCDDDIMLNPDWLEKTLDYSINNGWNVLGNKILNPDGTRHWDRGILNPRKLVPYDHHSGDKNLIQTSGFFMVRKNVYLNTKWNEEALVYADRDLKGIPEDVQYSLQLHKKDIILHFNKDAIVWHCDENYTEVHDSTLDLQTILKVFNTKVEPYFSKKFKSCENYYE